MEKKFDKIKYIDDYNKENYGRFDSKIKKELFLEIEDFRNRMNLSRAEFIEQAYILLKNKKGEMKNEKK